MLRNSTQNVVGSNQNQITRPLAPDHAFSIIFIISILHDLKYEQIGPKNKPPWQVDVIGI